MGYLADITAQVGTHDMVEALVKAGVLTDAQVDGFIDTPDRRVPIDAKLDSEELVDEAKTKTLREELEDRSDYVVPDRVDVHLIADAIGHLKRGEGFVAEALFARALEGAEIAPISQALAR